jgi:hypothetical protein
LAKPPHPEKQMTTDARGLVPLDELDDLVVAEGYTDIRGFEAYLPDGRKIGEVDQLLVDTTARRVAVITLDLDDDGPDIGREPHPRVAIEHVTIDTPSRRVLIQSAALGDLGLVPGRAATAPPAGGLFEAAPSRDPSDERVALLRDEADATRERMAAGAAEPGLGRPEPRESGDVLPGGDPLRGGRDLDGDGVR